MKRAPAVPMKVSFISVPPPKFASNGWLVALRRPADPAGSSARAADLGVGWEERDITSSPDDMRDYWDKIPVTFVDGVQIDFWRVSEARLRAALE